MSGWEKYDVWPAEGPKHASSESERFTAVFKTEIQLRETKFLAAARQRTSHAEEANFFSEACSVNYIVMKSCTVPVEHCQGMIPFDLLWDILNVN